jgi:hypothetical protein
LEAAMMWLILLWLVCSVLGAAVAPRGSTLAGFTFGLLLGPLGVIVAACLREPRDPRREALHRIRVEREMARLRAGDGARR